MTKYAALIAQELNLTNQLLSALRREEFERLAPHLRKASLASGGTIFDIGDELQQEYFCKAASRTEGGCDLLS